MGSRVFFLRCLKRLICSVVAERLKRKIIIVLTDGEDAVTPFADGFAGGGVTSFADGFGA